MAAFSNLPSVPQAEPYFVTINAIWPDLQNYRTSIAPARNGMDRRTGKLIQGWDHVEQSIEVIFATPFHERVLRRWVGSFVPHILGEITVGRVITRFFWAIASAVDLWEPNYRIKQVFYMGDALSSEWAPRLTNSSAAALVRIGQAIFRQEGIYRPRGHLGDFSPFEQRSSALTGQGDQLWDGVPVTTF